jgi:molybdopterin-synthase adenylyltransferase
MGLRVKPGHSLNRMTSGAVWIGPLMYGQATELSDESGVVWAICERLDGTRDRAALVTEVLAQCPSAADITAADIGEIIDFCIESGWLLDTEAPVPPEISGRERERYQRNAEFLSALDLRPGVTGFDLQARLKASRVAVLGLGGVGTAVAASLAACGVGRMHCVDSDVVELSNLNRQLLYTEHDIGTRKVAAAVAHLSERNSDISITGADTWLDGPESVAHAVAGADAIVLCADQADADDDLERWTNLAAYAAGVPWLTAGYSGPKLSLSCFIPGQTACYWCLSAERRRQQDELGIIRERLFRDRNDNPVIAPTAQISGHFLALETVKVLVGLPAQTAGRELHRYVTDYTEHYYDDAEPRPDCPAGCGAKMHR